jgi:predicted nucleic acid-binding protein
MPQNSLNKIVIADTSCLIGLNNINKLDLLKQLYDIVEITPEVKQEYEKKGDVIPAWFIIKEPENKSLVNTINKFLGKGEAESIVLAKEEDNALLILDDSSARLYAIDLGLQVAGTMSIIDMARKEKLITGKEAIELITTMKQMGFHIKDRLLDTFIEGINENK